MSWDELSHDEQMEFLRRVDIGDRVRVFYNSGMAFRTHKSFEGYVAGIDLETPKVVLAKRNVFSTQSGNKRFYQNIYCRSITAYVLLPPEPDQRQLELVFS